MAPSDSPAMSRPIAPDQVRQLPAQSSGSRPVAAEGLWTPFAREVIRRIVRGDYPAGSLVPTEAELGAEFGVSRTVIREGTKVLADKGLLRSQRGRGTEVLASSNWHSFDPDILVARLDVGDRDVVLREVLILRRCIEPELAANAVVNATDADLDRLGVRFAELEGARSDPERYKALDERFHQVIYDLGRVSLLRDILNVLELPIRIQRDLTGSIPGGNPRASHEQHRAVFRAIVERDPDRARAAMRDHLLWAEVRLDSVLADPPDEVRGRRRPRRTGAGVAAR